MSTQENALAVREEAAVSRPADLMTIIQNVVSGPLDLQKVEVLERLLAMQERVMVDQRKQAFADAMNRVQAVVPQITKDGTAHTSKFARLEDIDIIVRPILTREGFSISLNEEEANGDNRKYTSTLLHRGGHSETKSITLPVDKSGGKNSVQACGSTATYAQRYLLCMHLNIVTKGGDNDGNKQGFINDDQLKDLETLLQDTKSDLPRFLAHFKITSVKELPAREYGAALQMLETKKRGMK